MNSFQLFEGIGEIDDRFLEESQNYRRRPSHIRILRWASAAACLVIAVAGGLLYTKSHILTDTSSNTPRQTEESAEAAAFSADFFTDSDDLLYGSEELSYTIASRTEILTENNLPEEIPADQIGRTETILNEHEKICQYLPLKSVPAVRILCREGKKAEFLLYHGGAAELSLGELYGISGHIEEIVLGKRSMPSDAADTAAPLLSSLTPDSKRFPEEHGENLSVKLENGLTIHLVYHKTDKLLTLADQNYPVSGQLAEILDF